ncbi:MAG: hypothetical protein WC878_05550 [Candidatus Paceibacterota bacterium]|jgi:hypothetical protein
MQEKLSSIEKRRSELPIEQQANFEGSWTNLMCERLRNPEIRKQIIDILYEIEQSEKDSPVGKNPADESRECFIKDDKQTNFTRYYVPRKREEIEKDFDEDLQMVEQYTPINFSGKGSRLEDEVVGGREFVDLKAIYPSTGEKFTEKMRNFTESHEKGHVLRTYNFVQSRKKGLLRRYHRNWEGADARFRNAFDFSKIDYHDEYEKIKENFIRTERKGKLMEEKDARLICEGYLRMPMEIAERMSQLKNYFGMKSNEVFTKEHLAYAKEHFISDTSYDNNMTHFFQAITTEKEGAFIELINSAGI